jgi:dihydropteroate synthase
MGVVNVTPDSFSDGGEHPTCEQAIEFGLQLLDEGADILDIGGESTRPGAVRPSVEVELGRVVEVVAGLTEAGAAVSVDTMRAEVATQAVAAGAILVNDVSGGMADPAMLETVADLGVGLVVQHWRAPADQMEAAASYADVVTDVRRELAAQVDRALHAGIAADALIVDPGLGFSKNAEHNWALLNHLDSFGELGCPLLVGASRKRFLGELLAANGHPRPVDQRDDATLALTTLLAERGVWGVRTHTVRPHRDAIAVVGRMAGSHCAAFR